MRRNCPHCEKNLQRRLVLSQPVPGQRKLFPSKAIAYCPHYKGLLAHNKHPIEQFELWLGLLAAVIYFTHQALPVSLVIGTSVLFAIGMAAIGAGLKDWQRYKKYDPPSPFTM